MKTNEYPKHFALNCEKIANTRNQAISIAKGLWEANQELAEEVAHEIYELRDEEPMPELKVDTKVLVWADGREDTKLKSYFSHFGEDNRIYCFQDGTTSWSTTWLPSEWDNWELADE